MTFKVARLKTDYGVCISLADNAFLILGLFPFLVYIRFRMVTFYGHQKYSRIDGSPSNNRTNWITVSNDICE